MGIKRFKFRLEKVLQHRETIKEERKREVFLRNKALKEELEKLEALETAWLSNNIGQDGPNPALVPAEMIFMAGMFTQRLKLEIEQQMVRIEEARQAVDAAMSAYIEAAQDVQTMETLRKRRLDEYNAHLSREESKWLDELTVQKGNTVRNNKEVSDG